MSPIVDIILSGDFNCKFSYRGGKTFDSFLSRILILCKFNLKMNNDRNLSTAKSGSTIFLISYLCIPPFCNLTVSLN